MNPFLADVRHSFRLLRRAPGFAIAVTLILALGIGANSALFTAIDRTVIRPLPYAKPEQLAKLWEDFTAFGGVRKTRVSPGTYADWQKRTQAFQEIGTYGLHSYDLSGGGGPPEEIIGLGVSSNLFPLLSVKPLYGRTFTAAEEAPGNKVVVLSYGLWQRRFGGRADVIGQDALMNGEKYAVIGIMPKGFQFPDNHALVWTPLDLSPQMFTRRHSHFLHVVGRLKEGQTMRQGQADMDVIARDLGREFPATNDRVGITVVPLKEEFLGDAGREFTLLLCAAGCVLLIACANVGNLLLARSAARQREIAVRVALGASPSRVLRQVLTESMVLSATGGALGLVVAQLSMAGLEQMVPPTLAGAVTLGLNGRAVAFTAAVSMITGVSFGLAPALQLSKAGVAPALKSSGRASVFSGGRRIRDVLVTGEMAIALVLVIGAVLMIQTLVRLRAVDPGFREQGILTATITSPFPRYQDTVKRQRFYSDIQDKVAAIPGVKSVGLSSDLPYTSRGNTMSLTVEGHEEQRDLGMDALFRLVGAGYLETIGARLKEGRFLEPGDQMDSPAVVVVNETLALEFWPNQSALGHRVDSGTGNGSPKWMTIVGVVRDIRERGLDLGNKRAVYVPFTQTTIGFFLPSEIAVLTSREPMSLAKELQRAVWSVDPEQPVSGIATMESIVDGELANRTQVLRLLGVFAGLALMLAALGIYGVLSYVVSQRTPEIGLRMALGADRWNIVRIVLSYSARLTALGLAIGVLVALGATRLLASLLYGITALDPVTFIAVVSGIAAVALFASLAPVLRAASVDPIVALRNE